MNSLFNTVNNKSKTFENTVSIVTTAAAAGIAVSKAINKNEKVGAVLGVGIGLLIYSMFGVKSKLKNENKRLEDKLSRLERGR